MNNVGLTGRLTKPAERRKTIVTFTLAVDRDYKKEGEQDADFIRIVCFGKTADFVENYGLKGRLCEVNGRINTGSYKDEDGKTIYTTDVIAERVRFLDRFQKDEGEKEQDEKRYSKVDDDDCPF